MRTLIDGTNSYAARVIDEKDQVGKLAPNSRWRRWKPVTSNEMKAVLAIMINMGIIHCPEIEGHWKTSWECYIPFFHDILSRNRFKEIFWMLYLPESTTPTHRIDEVKSLLDILLASFQSVFYPSQDVSIDETMIGFKGRISFMQYCPNKPTKCGLKVFVLADSKTRYIFNILPYTGRKTRETYMSNCDDDLPMYTQVVVALLEKYLDKGHHLYADRFYTSAPLVEELEKRKTGYTGTLVRTRKQLPKEVQQKGFKLEKGEMKGWRDGNGMVVAWRDKGKPVVLISSVHPVASTTVINHQGLPKIKPVAVDEYNQSMGGVDKADQYSVYYLFERRTVKWWRKLMFWMMEVALVNSFILYKLTVNSSASHVNYQLMVAVGLCEGLPVGDV